MTEVFEATVDLESLRDAGFPQSLTTGATILVASAADPVQSDIGLQLLSYSGENDDSALVVTSTESADQTITSFEDIPANDGQPALHLVDTVSKQQSLSSHYGDPIVYTPSPGDLERLVVALAELSGTHPPDDGERHLLVRSLTPILEATAIEKVCTVLQKITGIRSEEGISLLGFEYTAHDEETLAALREQVDGVLWVTPNAEGAVELEYRPTRRYRASCVPANHD